MTLETNNLKKILSALPDRTAQRHWAEPHKAQPISREAAVENVAKVFRDQNLPQPDRNDVGVELLEAMTTFGRFFKDTSPSDQEIEEVITKARTDYHAFLALKLLALISQASLPQPLRDWEHKVYLKIEKQPAVPRGPSAVKFAHRDMLIVKQIEQLEIVGFVPTRSSAARHSDSACDVIVDAFARLGIHMSYDAIEAVWKQRGVRTGIRPIAELFCDGLLARLPG